MNKIKIVFFGTHEFASTILQGLLDNPNFEIALVITQPDKPVGRKQELQPPAVKILAQKHSLTVEQPISLKLEVVSQKSYNLQLTTYDLAIVCQYGLIIPQKLLEQPKFGFINVHTSLLPKYRGASPIQSALVNGETETGVTIMKMDAGMDTGPILTQKACIIDKTETYTTLSNKLAKIANLELPKAILGYISSKIAPEPQDNSLATYTKILTRDDGKIDWSKSVKEIYNQYRGHTPWPGVWTTWNNKRVKLLQITPSEIKISNSEFKVNDGKLLVGCNNGSIEVLELQVEGSKPTDAKSFINGYLK
ncbi:MAG: Methionyl-tRNA formyltransferase [Candidatus Magasanikbacteria bacterium GW2011_GWC2_37_14]|uniref:Methionyl-tRNA formyltransferase n=1 Tax=Candidatus Magasanikbacteria bacterium GW2011_GWC2_37_14 TaxID=1619046 RepID=A0A0G0IVH3_9BACT|nr:MAG: Methionyl-tRNA formyltransferase [Candidatus Magasanikbacteria bacterium GW2011_GWC2_37_14]